MTTDRVGRAVDYINSLSLDEPGFFGMSRIPAENMDFLSEKVVKVPEKLEIPQNNPKPLPTALEVRRFFDEYGAFIRPAVALNDEGRLTVILRIPQASNFGEVNSNRDLAVVPLPSNLLNAFVADVFTTTYAIMSRRERELQAKMDLLRAEMTLYEREMQALSADQRNVTALDNELSEAERKDKILSTRKLEL